MARTLRIKRIKGLAEMGQVFRKLLKRDEQAARTVIATCTLNIQTRARRKAPVDTGRLRADIRPFFRDKGLTGEVNTALLYAPHIEFGTGKHRKRRGSKEFVRGIEKWMRRHGIPEEALFPILRKIRKEGTDARPFLGPAYDKEVKRCLANLKRQLKRASERR